jgi:integrase
MALDCHLTPVIRPLLLCDVDAREVALYQAKRKAGKVSARTLNKELQVLRMILKRYKLWANLQGDVKFEREPNETGKALTTEQEAALLTACQSNPLLLTVVIVALNTTLRKSEIRTLRWRQLTLRTGLLLLDTARPPAAVGEPCL